jgi:hypothetical protein
MALKPYRALYKLDPTIVEFNYGKSLRVKACQACTLAWPSSKGASQAGLSTETSHSWIIQYKSNLYTAPLGYKAINLNLKSKTYTFYYPKLDNKL